MKRNGINIKKYLKKYPKGHFIILKDFQEIDISFSSIRSKDKIDYLDKEIIEYIEKHYLYHQ